MKKTFVCLAVAMSLISGIFASGAKEESAKSVPAVTVDTSDPLKAKWAGLAGKTLKVGTGGVQLGWTMGDASNLEGMDIDVIKYICDYYGIKIEWTVSEYASLWGMVQNGVIDTIANLTTVNPDRLKLYWFTNTYAWESYSIAGRKADGIPEDGDMSYWNGKTLCGEAGSNATLVMEKIIESQKAKGIVIKELDLDAATVVFPAVAQKRADGAFQCTSTVAYAVKLAGYSDMMFIQDVKWKNMPIVYGWARRESNKDFILAFNDLIDQMHKDGTLAKFSKKWFSQDVTKLPAGEVNYVTTTGDNAWQSYQ